MSYQLLSESFPAAGKPHRCIWCSEWILVGEKHRHERSIFDGDFQNHRWHLECDKAAEEYFKDGESDFDPGSNERPPKNEIPTTPIQPAASP